MALNDTIIEILSDIQRQLGSLTGSSERQRETIKTFAEESVRWRETMTNRMDNAVGRIAVLEQDVNSIKTTLSKSVMPLIAAGQEVETKREQSRVWRTGYVAGASMIIGALVALIGFVAGPFHGLFMLIANYFAGG